MLTSVEITRSLTRFDIEYAVDVTVFGLVVILEPAEALLARLGGWLGLGRLIDYVGVFTACLSRAPLDRVQCAIFV